MAKPRTSNHLKVVRGTDQPCRMKPDEISFEALTGQVEPPQWLDAHAREYWMRIVPILQAKRILTEADLEPLAMTCMLYSKVRKQAEAGVDVNASLITQLRLYQTEFGLTPVSRNKVSGGDGKEKGNRFAANGQAGKQGKKPA